jgi:hypothetical protein
VIRVDENENVEGINEGVQSVHMIVTGIDDKLESAHADVQGVGEVNSFFRWPPNPSSTLLG